MKRFVLLKILSSIVFVAGLTACGEAPGPRGFFSLSSSAGTNSSSKTGDVSVKNGGTVVVSSESGEQINMQASNGFSGCQSVEFVAPPIVQIGSNGFSGASGPYHLNVKGSASRWKVKTSNPRGTTEEIVSKSEHLVTSNLMADFKPMEATRVREEGDLEVIAGGAKLYVAYQKLHMNFGHGGCTDMQWEENVAFNVVGLDENGKELSGSCSGDGTLKWVVPASDCGSPIVLDLGNRGLFSGLSQADSKVSFDIFGTGKKIGTGWVKPEMGFLAHDLNGNGLIDDGRELFGEGTRLSNGQRAADGYVAMASLDTNRDGFLDARDAEFGSLLVWTDSNMDGVSQASEIEKLSAFGVTKMSVKAERSLRHIGRDTAGNDVRFESRFWGPAQCGTQGCLSFDVFFAIARTTASVFGK